MITALKQDSITVKIYLTNQGAYNRGELRGEWIDLPMDEEELQGEINKLLDTPYKDEEYFITNFEAPFAIKEHESLFALNELAQELEGIYEDERVIEIIADDILGMGYSRDEFVRILQDREYSVVLDVWNEIDLATKVDEEFLPFDYSLVKKAGIESYLDWDAIGREMVMDGGWTIKSGLAVLVYR